MIPRAYKPLSQYLEKGKVLAIYGPRQVGKTTLIEDFLSSISLRYKLDSGDNIHVQHIMGSSDIDLITEYCKGYELLVLDEAQNIPGVGQGLKIITDHVKDIYVIATGSSSFDLHNKIGEPLVGRQRVLKMFPLCMQELNIQFNKVELDQRLEEFLIYGLYPKVITERNKNSKKEYLHELVNSYLLKDILTLENIKSPRLLMDLLRLLAFQVGSEVSLNELSNQLRVDVKTIGRYIDLLEKSFIILSLGGFSRNLRNEVTSKRKYYFLDTGIRNGVINSFNPLDTRNDIGSLWENFMILERLKKKTYQHIYSNDFFWRTYSKKEIDLIEERDGKLYAFEFKWKEQPYKAPDDWIKTYTGSTVELITRKNMWPFLL